MLAVWSKFSVASSVAHSTKHCYRDQWHQQRHDCSELHQSYNFDVRVTAKKEGRICDFRQMLHKRFEPPFSSTGRIFYSLQPKCYHFTDITLLLTMLSWELYKKFWSQATSRQGLCNHFFLAQESTYGGVQGMPFKEVKRMKLLLFLLFYYCNLRHAVCTAPLTVRWGTLKIGWNTTV